MDFFAKQQAGPGGTRTNTRVHSYLYHPLMFVAVRAERVPEPKGTGGITFLEAQCACTHMYPHLLGPFTFYSDRHLCNLDPGPNFQKGFTKSHSNVSHKSKEG